MPDQTLATANPPAQPANAAPAESAKPAEQTKPATTLATGAPPAETAKPTDATKPAEKPAEQPAKRAPEAYALKAPEGVTLPPESIKAVEDLARKLDLPNDQAQALLEHQVGLEGAIVEKQLAALETSRGKWLEDVRADKEIGGANFQATAEDCRRAVDKFAPKELKELLDATGYGNHPAFVRFAAAIGKAMREDVMGGQSRGESQRSLAERLYGEKPSA